jgi:D-amino-acid dehydrogenase
VSLFDELMAEERLECDYRPEGYYDVFLTERGLSAADHEAGIARKHDYHPERLSGDELRLREPALRDEIVGGVYYPEAGTLDPYRFVTGMADCAVRHGARLVVGEAVSNVSVSNGRVSGVRTAAGQVIQAGTVVLAAGAYTGALTRKLGLELPLQAAKGYHRDRSPEADGTPDMRCTVMLGEKSVFCTPMSGFVRFAGTLELSGLNHDIRRPRLEQLTNAAKHYLKGMGETRSRSEWCGLRPCLSDGVPAIGSVPGIDGLFLATGHAMLGLTLGPITGKLVAEMVVGEETSLDVAGLSPARF